MGPDHLPIGNPTVSYVVESGPKPNPFCAYRPEANPCLATPLPASRNDLIVSLEKEFNGQLHENENPCNGTRTSYLPAA